MTLSTAGGGGEVGSGGVWTGPPPPLPVVIPLVEIVSCEVGENR